MYLPVSWVFQGNVNGLRIHAELPANSELKFESTRSTNIVLFCHPNYVPINESRLAWNIQPKCHVTCSRPHVICWCTDFIYSQANRAQALPASILLNENIYSLLQRNAEQLARPHRVSVQYFPCMHTYIFCIRTIPLFWNGYKDVRVCARESCELIYRTDTKATDVKNA